MTDFFNNKIADPSVGIPKINCPKHGVHHQFISSTIEGHQGQWCMLCWLESLGPSLPFVDDTDD